MWSLLERGGSQLVGLRYFNVYGPGEARKGAMASGAWHFHRQLAATGRVRLFDLELDPGETNDVAGRERARAQRCRVHLEGWAAALAQPVARSQQLGQRDAPHVVGGRLARAGYDVSFVARGAHLAAMVLACDWAGRGIDPGFIAGATLLSGIYEAVNSARLDRKSVV